MPAGVVHPGIMHFSQCVTYNLCVVVYKAVFPRQILMPGNACPHLFEWLHQLMNAGNSSKLNCFTFHTPNFTLKMSVTVVQFAICSVGFFDYIFVL